MEETYVPIEDVAKHFTVSISTIRSWVRMGYMPPGSYIKIANTYRFNIPKIVEGLTPKAPPVEPAPPEPDAPVQLELDLNPDKDI